MNITAAQLKALADIGLTSEQVAAAVSILCPRTSADVLAERREKDRKRKELARARVRADKTDNADRPPPSASPSLVPPDPPITLPLQLPPSKLPSRQVAIEAEDIFETRFWKVYPPRLGDRDKKAARKAWNTAVKRADPEDIIAGAAAYAAELRARGKINTEFVKQARTWLNADGWTENYGKVEKSSSNLTSEQRAAAWRELYGTEPEPDPRHH